MFDTDQGARIVWNNLRARHYSVLILMAIVALETSAIAIDRFVLAESEEAFVVESSFQNNSFIRSFRMADASCAVLPVRINDFSVAHENNVSSNIYVSPLLENKKESTVTTVAALPAEDHIVSQRVSADFVAASGNQDSYSNYIEYSVQPGDNISNIAEMCGTKTDAIKKANNLDNSIKAGQTIVVPTQRTHMVYTVKKGDSLSRIASRFNVSMENLINANSLKTHVLMADQKIIIPVAKTEAGLALVKSPTSSEERTKKVALVRSENLEKVKDSSKLQMIKLDNKLQMVAAAAPAQKSEISFDDDSKKTSSTAVAKAKTPAKESVELKLNNSTRASVASADTKKSVKAAETAKAEIAKTAANAVAIKQEAEADLEDESEEVESITYKVAKGDSLLKIAHKFNTTAAQIQSDNNIKGDVLKLGQSLKISPNKKLYRVVKSEDVANAKASEATTVIKHKVQTGESLSLLAKKYNTSISDIVSENNMTNTVVMAGETIKIPVKKNKNFKITKVQSKSSKKVSWKTPTKGWLSSPYGWRLHPVRKKRLFHAGIDIAAPKGTAINCVAPGRVIYAGTRTGYGKLIIVSHENGLSTRYAHCSQILVKNGQIVKEGQLIGKVGATGVATGPHLHFEVRKNGKTQNPTSYVKL